MPSNLNAPFCEFILRNKHNNEIRLLNYGATLQGLTVHDNFDRPIDVVLGYDAGSDYASEASNYFGATIGRIAGRVSNGGFLLEGHHYPLEQNHGNYHIHGGVEAMSHQFWEGSYMNHAGNKKVVFNYESCDGENGYPGNLSICTSYEWTDENYLIIIIEATTDQTTPLAMTNHAYFNLNGAGKEDIQNLILQIDADECVAVQNDLGHTGKKYSLDGLPDDFRSPLTIGSRLKALHKSHGAMYISRQQEQFGKRATLMSEKTGIQMEVWSNQKYTQFYTGEHLKDVKGKVNIVYDSFSGVCFECQGYPDAPNFPEFDSINLEPGQRYRNHTEYRFSVL